MTSVSSRPVARLSSPGDVVATVPLLCGFRPQDSVVLLSLRGRRRRLGLTVRLDLPPACSLAQTAAALVGRVVQDGGRAAVLVVYADATREAVVQAVSAACAGAGVELVEALHVAGDRWTSYRCSGACCPPGGTPVGEAPALVQAEHVLDGRAVLGDRDELVRALAAPVPGAVDAVRAARAAWAAAAPAAARAHALASAREALTRPVPMSEAAAAGLAVALHDRRVRDEVATWALDHDGALLALLEQVVRRVGAPYDAPACTVLAWVAYCRGDGARANVALDRALHSDPQHALALLLRSALDGAVPPAEVRRILRATARALRDVQ